MDGNGSLDVVIGNNNINRVYLNNGTTDEIPIDDKPDNEFQTNFPMTGGGSRYGASVKGAGFPGQ